MLSSTTLRSRIHVCLMFSCFIRGDKKVAQSSRHYLHSYVLDPLVSGMFEGPSRAVASLQLRKSYPILLFYALTLTGFFFFNLQTHQHNRWTRFLWHDYHKQGKQSIEGNCYICVLAILI